MTSAFAAKKKMSRPRFMDLSESRRQETPKAHNLLTSQAPATFTESKCAGTEVGDMARGCASSRDLSSCRSHICGVAANSNRSRTFWINLLQGRRHPFQFGIRIIERAVAFQLDVEGNQSRGDCASCFRR